MKKCGIINADISRVLSYMGHTDTLAVGDCGLPIPDETERIDLALKMGTPSFMETLEEVVKNMKIEKVILAEEIREKKSGNPCGGFETCITDGTRMCGRVCGACRVEKTDERL